MSQVKLDRQVKMVNQIALNMSANGDQNKVANQIAEHLEKFWSPAMKNLIIEQPSLTDMGLSPLAQIAIQNLLLMQQAKKAI